jgi:hypothetical protein
MRETFSVNLTAPQAMPEASNEKYEMHSLASASEREECVDVERTKCVHSNSLSAFSINNCMYKTQYKSRSPLSPWQVLGIYSNEADAINAALRKKKTGALIVRIHKMGSGIVYFN